MEKKEIKVDGYYIHREVIISTWVSASHMENPKNIHEAFECAMEIEFDDGEFNEQNTEVEVVYKPDAKGRSKAEVIKYDQDKDYSGWFDNPSKDR